MTTDYPFNFKFLLPKPTEGPSNPAEQKQHWPFKTMAPSDNLSESHGQTSEDPLADEELCHAQLQHSSSETLPQPMNNVAFTRTSSVSREMVECSSDLPLP